MKVKELIAILEEMPPEIDIKIMEGKKHDDDAPLMSLVSVDKVKPDYSKGNKMTDIVLLVSEPNPDTIVPMQKKFESDLKITAEIMRQAAVAVQPFFPGKGFALVAFDFGTGLRDFSYISNSQRTDMIATFEQLIIRWKNQKVRDN